MIHTSVSLDGRTDRLRGNDGIVAMITNNSFVHKNAFDGMRKHLAESFTSIYHLDLAGDVKLDPHMSGTAYNVFGIQVGVGITIAVRNRLGGKRGIFYHNIPKDMKRHDKLRWLSEGHFEQVSWTKIAPDQANNWIYCERQKEFQQYLLLGSQKAKSLTYQSDGVIFSSYSLGVSTNRDATVYGYNRNEVAHKVQTLISSYNNELDTYRRYLASNFGQDDGFVFVDSLKWSLMLKQKLRRGKAGRYNEDRIQVCFYRPFTTKALYFDPLLVDAPALQAAYFPDHSSGTNYQIVLSDKGYRSPLPNAIMVNALADLHLCASVDGHQAFSLRVYSRELGCWKDNITDWALAQFQSHYSSSKITKEDIFFYVYAILMHRKYKALHADCLRNQLPRIPYAPDFYDFVSVGQELSKLHTTYEAGIEHPLEKVYTPGVPYSPRVEKMKLSKDKTSLVINDSLTLRGIPPQALEYRLGNRSALDWVIDQYRVTKDAYTGNVSDPNRADDPEYIIRLVGQVVAVSLKTVELVNALPDFLQPEETR